MRFNLQQFIYSIKSNPAIGAFWLMVAAALLFFAFIALRDLVRNSTCPSCGARFSYWKTGSVETGSKNKTVRTWDYKEKRWVTEDKVVTSSIVFRKCKVCGYSENSSESSSHTVDMR